MEKKTIWRARYQHNALDVVEIEVIEKPNTYKIVFRPEGVYHRIINKKSIGLYDEWEGVFDLTRAEAIKSLHRHYKSVKEYQEKEFCDTVAILFAIEMKMSRYRRKER